MLNLIAFTNMNLVRVERRTNRKMGRWQVRTDWVLYMASAPRLHNIDFNSKYSVQTLSVVHIIYDIYALAQINRSKLNKGVDHDINV